jgi:hypothetical protein
MIDGFDGLTSFYGTDSKMALGWQTAVIEMMGA